SDRLRSEQLRREHSELAELAERLIRRPDDDDLRCRAARWMLDHGRAEEGVRWARLVLRDHPDHPEANRLMAEHHRRRGAPGLANFYRLHAAPDPPAGAGVGADQERGSAAHHPRPSGP